MERHSIAGFCFETYQQGFKAIEPGTGLLHHFSSLIEFFVKVDVVLCGNSIYRVEAMLASIL